MMYKDATLSHCGKYRYRLVRLWNTHVQSVSVIMLNPSTADAYEDDNTIRALHRILRALGFGGFVVYNLFALRATDPTELTGNTDPLGLYNPAYLSEAVNSERSLVLAWGAHRMASLGSIVLRKQMEQDDKIPFCLGRTLAGAPKHPLYLPTNSPLKLYDWPECQP